jgi:hypothetical protein
MKMGFFRILSLYFPLALMFISAQALQYLAPRPFGLQPFHVIHHRLNDSPTVIATEDTQTGSIYLPIVMSASSSTITPTPTQTSTETPPPTLTPTVTPSAVIPRDGEWSDNDKISFNVHTGGDWLDSLDFYADFYGACGVSPMWYSFQNQHTLITNGQFSFNQTFSFTSFPNIFSVKFEISGKFTTSSSATGTYKITYNRTQPTNCTSTKSGNWSVTRP